MDDFRIGLALSGGGVRAAAFHLGVLRCLWACNLLKHIKYISTVSGGSLLIGLVFYLSQYRWPTDETFPEVREKVKGILVSKNLQLNSLARLIFFPWNWRYMGSRANILSKSIKNCWGIKGELKDLPETPIWAINGTTIETGKRWRFKNCEMGDYKIGYSKVPSLEIADAMAISAAFPGGITPYKIKTKNYKWLKPKKWEDKIRAPHEPKFKKLHIADGGLYDNLGVEPLFDHSKINLKSYSNINWLIVSDAGKQLKPIERPPSIRILKRLLHMTSILTDQVRSLRIRNISQYFSKTGKGVYLQIGECSEDILKRAQNKYNKKPLEYLKNCSWLDSNACIQAGKYKTTLSKIPRKDFDLIERCGYEIALANLGAYASGCLRCKIKFSAKEC
jgi:NTE family protein